MTTHTSFCRICQAFCGVRVDVEDNRITRILGDRDNPVSRGFTCPKGRMAGELVHGPNRLHSSLERTADGEHRPIAAADAAQAIGGKLRDIIAEHGPDSVGIFLGTQGIFGTLTNPMARGWFAGTGSRKLFTTMTIDQSAKWVVTQRMGEYQGGRQAIEDSDVWMLVGTNPLVSVNGGAGDGVLVQNPSATLRTLRERGLKLIVIDPRRTETAFNADLHLAPLPGHDALIFATILNVILSEGLHDRDFCARYVDGVEALAEAVRLATPTRVEQVAHLPGDQLIAAARLFAAGPRGMVSTGTGVCMGPHSNLAEHLAMAINVVCGRFRREGEPAAGPAVLTPDIQPCAEVMPPDPNRLTGWRSRLGAPILRGELPSNTLADEILEPGPDRIRALIVSGGNPALALPDAGKARRALGSLDLLVSIDTRLSETAQLADYVIAPTMLYERADSSFLLERYFAQSFAIYTDPVLTPPPGVVEDWQFFWHLAKAMDQPLSMFGKPVDMDRMPSSRALLEALASDGRVPLSEVAQAPHGYVAAPRTTRVGPPQGEQHRLALLPPDVAGELAAALGDTGGASGEMRLVVRRMREMMNSLGREVDRLPRQPYNPAFLNPDDMTRLGLADGATVRLETPHGRLEAIATPDHTVRPGVVSITHGWGGVDPQAEAPREGINVNRLTGNDAGTQTINHMPILTGMAVQVSARA